MKAIDNSQLIMILLYNIANASELNAENNNSKDVYADVIS
jgi:hypothetical protein